MVVLAFVGGSFIFLAVLVVMVVVIAFSYYTYRGSGINAHPHDGRDQAPGAGAPSDPARPGRIPEDPVHPEEEGSITTHGTK